MENKILGLHHITAIAGDPQQNYDFYTKVLGLRMVKKTVNFDDPQTYHFYFGDKTGSPGTILTFFPWPGAKKGKNGVGMATEIGYSVPEASLDFWQNRFDEYKVNYGSPSEEFGEKLLPFEDPDGLKLKLIIPSTPDSRQGWETNEINKDVALKGFHNVTLNLSNQAPTAGILTDIFDYKFKKQERNRFRYITDAVENASIIDLIEDPSSERGINAAGTNHHIAFRVNDEASQRFFRDKIVEAGLNITGKIDRDYFYSLYFREPGGVLFEIATDNPGFTRDESLDELGSSLKLPEKYESSRERIENLLPKLSQ
ncbi:MAG: ring-cleaving dioxygenase [Salegentibacter sp.]|uniref:Glyoxalase family protein n=1 Tax=Salegentibacter flavus TaxID=287099 RepID=A0A1I5BS50_9FLAO|nr:MULTISPECIES: ring-cleaving dioxygenase [Salegentibacter]MDR9457672.1 ring-cleaving dioxygenase [Salegentibacter sp.]SFN77539.1 glyoxalase family protein [Salegentibacter flavus]